MMATPFGARFRRDNGATAAKSDNEDRVGEMLSDSSDSGSPLGGDVRPSEAKLSKPRLSNNSSLRSSSASDEKISESAAVKWKRSKSECSDAIKSEDATESEQMLKGIQKRTFGSLSQSSRTSMSTKRSAGRKWYSDSDEEDEETKGTSLNKESFVRSIEDEDSDLDGYIAGSVMNPRREETKIPPPTSGKQARSKLKRLNKHRERTGDGGSESYNSGSVALAARDGSKKTNMLKLIAKTSTMAPFGIKVKGSGVEDSDVPTADSLANTNRDAPSSTEHSALDPSVVTNSRVGKPIEVQTGGARNVPAIIINRRTDRLKHSASGSEYGGSPRVAINSADEVLSPGLRKVPGAFPGRPGSGVLLEGWLRQKQRRGIKGLKKWNSRYFVLYARLNEVRYYADVVQSAWGPIPLGEIGSISLRLIQRIGKLSHPKYKGCRFDITCRNSWGTHYADDYVSSDEENANGSNHVGPASNIEKPTTSTPSKQEKSGTPKSSRVYSLVSDSPQVTVAWVNMLDSLLIRSANSPRPDVDSPVENAGAISATSASGRGRRSRAIARQQSSALNTESLVLTGPEEPVPMAIIYAINFIFDSTPGIETEKFYEIKPDATKLKVALKFLNEFAGESGTRKPTKEELEELLDATTAGAIVQLWLNQLDQPLIPFAMYEDFATLAHEMQSAPFDLRRNLGALFEALPTKNLYDQNPVSSTTKALIIFIFLVHCSTMLACLLFHLNDVSVYSSKNGMDAAKLAHLFTKYILRPQQKSSQADSGEEDVNEVVRLVEEMITNVDTFIDEKEAQLLEDNRL